MNSIQNLEHSRSDQAETIITKTTCPYCGVGCGVDVTVNHKAQGTTVQVAGDLEHPSNFGRLCIKGSNLADTIGLETRLLQPMLGRNTQQKTTTWDTALNQIAQQFQSCIEQYGAESIAFYVSGQLLTEDYYVANKLMKGFVGSANIDTNSRLCMASAVAAHSRAFDEDIVPVTYDDLDEADLIVLVGSNTAWCHPVIYQRLVAAKAARPGGVTRGGVFVSLLATALSSKA